MTFKVLAAFLASSINEFLVVFSVAFIYMFVRNFVKINLYEAIYNKFSNGFSYLRRLSFEDLTMSSFASLAVIVTVFVAIKNMYFFDMISSKGFASIFMRPESIAGFIIAFNDIELYGEIPRTRSEKMRMSLTCLVSVIFDALMAMFLIPFLCFGILKVFSLMTVAFASEQTVSFVGDLLKKFIRTSFVFSYKFYVLSFSALLGRLIPLPFSEGFYIIFPFMSDRALNYLYELEIAGKFMVRFVFLFFFAELLAYMISGPLNNPDPARLFLFLTNAL